MNIENKSLLGLTQEHLCGETTFDHRIHSTVVEPLKQLAMKAEAAGYALRIASGFRSFERQLLIWNSKASGQRAVLDIHGDTLDLSCMSDYEKALAILRWSALPGASRHHWGCDFDVYDANAVSTDYRIQLTQEECSSGGVFSDFHCWLTQQLSHPEASLGFYRPYDIDRGGVAPEPWHLSFRPVAQEYSRALTVDVLRQQLNSTDLQLKASVLSNIEEIYSRFIVVDNLL